MPQNLGRQILGNYLFLASFFLAKGGVQPRIPKKAHGHFPFKNVVFLGVWKGHFQPSLGHASEALGPTWEALRLGLHRAKWTRAVSGDRLPEVTQKPLLQERKIRPKEEVFGPDIPRTSGGHSRGYPGPKLRSGHSKSWNNKHLGADIHDPKVRMSHDPKGFPKTSVRKTLGLNFRSLFLGPRSLSLQCRHWQLESACRVSTSWDAVTVPTVCFLGDFRGVPRGVSSSSRPKPLRVHLLGIDWGGTGTGTVRVKIITGSLVTLENLFSPNYPLPLPSWNSDEFPLPLPSWCPQSPLHFHWFPITVLKVIWINFPKNYRYPLPSWNVFLN